MSSLLKLRSLYGVLASPLVRVPDACNSTVGVVLHVFLRGVFAIALMVVSLPSTAQIPFHRAAWKADLAQLKTALEAQYANLAWKASVRGDADLPRLSRDADAALDRADTDARAEDAIRAFVAGFHDGHLSELPKL